LTRRAAALYAVRAWIDRGLRPEPSWTAQQLRQVRDIADRGPGPQAPHGTPARWSHGCDCLECHQAHSDRLRSYGRARAQDRLSIELRDQLLAAIFAGQPFRQVLSDLVLTPNQVWVSPGPMPSGRKRWMTLRWLPVEMISSMGLMRRTSQGACAASVGSTSN
jgi:hypothetical protein